jgi:Tfp pilus assembly protein PilF
MKNRKLTVLLIILGGVVALTTLLITTYRMPEPETRMPRSRKKSALSEFVRLAIFDIEANRVAEAEKNLKAAIAKNPGDDIAIRLLGRFYYDRAQYEDAEKMFMLLIEHDSTDASAYNNLGQVLFRRGKTTEALNALKTSLSLNPNSALAHLNIAWIYSVNGDKELSREHLEKSRQLLDRNSVIINPDDQMIVDE